MEMLMYRVKTFSLRFGTYPSVASMRLVDSLGQKFSFDSVLTGSKTLERVEVDR